MTVVTNLRLVKSILNLLETDPTPELCELSAIVYYNQIELGYKTHCDYVTSIAKFHGAAVKALWELLQTVPGVEYYNNVTQEYCVWPQNGQLLTLNRVFDRYNLRLSYEVLGSLYRILKRQYRLLTLLASKTSLPTATREQIFSVDELLNCAIDTERWLNNSTQHEVSEELHMCGVNYNAEEVEKTIRLRNSSMFYFEEQVELAEVKHIRPYTFVGFWVDLQENDRFHGLRVAFAFDDTRIINARLSAMRVKHCTMQAGLYYGINSQFWISNSNRQWIEANGTTSANNINYKFVSIAEVRKQLVRE